MASLDRGAFSEVLRLVALRIRAQQCSTFMKRLDGHILSRPKVRPIIKDEAEGGCAQTRLLLLAGTVLDTQLRGLPEELRTFVLEEGAVPLVHEQTMGYELLTVEQVLRRLLPQGMEVPSAFEQVGHVAHVNLRDEQLPYKAVIGQVILDKNSRLRSVVNKVESINNEFRVFPMEVLAGEHSLVTSVRENGATFELDYREVYWNSRLEREHWRVVELIGEDEVVCDMMAGIGPFALPAALRGSRVYANDLNPHSAHWLRRNVVANKAQRSVHCYNLCGREFHVVMNLPATALTFLDVFKGAFDRQRWQAPLPRVHCHCFSKAEDPGADVIGQAEAILGCPLPGATAHVVRDVSPHKLMMCVSFLLPDAVCWADGDGGAAAAAACGSDQKRQRSE